MANRLKTVLPQLITEHHSTFTKGHLILDNILIAFETLCSMQKYNSDKDDFMAVKLNTNKAYDKVEWGILGVGDEKDEFY